MLTDCLLCIEVHLYVRCIVIQLFSFPVCSLTCFLAGNLQRLLKLLKMCVYLCICTCDGSEGYWLPERLPKQLVGKLQDTRKPLVCLNIQIFSPLLRCKNIVSMCSLFFQICPCKQRALFSPSFPVVLCSSKCLLQLSCHGRKFLFVLPW